jgi:hypothetical protein
MLCIISLFYVHLHQDSFLFFIIFETFHFVLGEDMRRPKSNLTRNKLFFPSPKRLQVWIRNCLRGVFCHLSKNQGLGKDLRNSWRCFTLFCSTRIFS